MPDSRGIPSSLAEALWMTAKQAAPGAAEVGLSIAPGSGEAMAARDAWDASGRGALALGQGEWGKAANEYGTLATALLGAIPGAGIVARGTKRGAAWMDRNMPAWLNKGLDTAMPSDPKNQLNIFAGPNAKTADHVALANAQEMAGSGASRDDIWRDTGWYQGVDGKWRFEIDDSTVDLTDKAAKSFDATHSTQGTASDIVDHPALWQAYPDLGNTATLLQKGPIEGAYFPSGVLHASAPDYQNAVSVNLHELQHGVQYGEDFIPGGNAKIAKDHRPEAEVAALRHSLQSEADRLMSEGADLIRAKRYEEGNAMQKQAWSLKGQAEKMQSSGSGAYHRLAGEVEARNVEKRMNMSPVERRAKAPWLTQDVPDDQQIVRYR